MVKEWGKEKEWGKSKITLDKNCQKVLKCDKIVAFFILINGSN